MTPNHLANITAIALALSAATVFAAVMSSTDQHEHPHVTTPATMEDVARWSREGCTTDTDCERWDRWTDAVCLNADACALALTFGALSPNRY